MSDEKRDNGGPAFPTEPNTQPGHFAHHGMTLRDWFAGQALAGMLAQGDPEAEVCAAAADYAYTYADAMLEERKR